MYQFNILPDETLYSYIVRRALCSGYPDARTAVKDFFGNDNYQFSSQFPCLIPALSKLTHCDPNYLIRHHTALPFFKGFTKQTVYNTAYKKLLEGNSKDLHTRLSLVSSRLTHGQCLRLCNDCIINDKATYGVAYWHVSHQLQGQFACLKHKTRLHSVEILRRDFILPFYANSQTETALDDVMIHLSSVLNAFFTQSQYLDCALLLAVYSRQLSLAGYQTPKGRLRINKLNTDLIDFWQSVLVLPMFKKLLLGNTTNAFPAELFYQNENQHQPIKHALLIGFLFKDVQSFFGNYNSSRHTTVTFDSLCDMPMKTARNARATELEVLGRLLQKHSMRAISKSCHLSISQIKKLAVQNGVEPERRAQKLFQNERKKIIELAERGELSSSIAQQMSCSMGAVEQIISQQNGLVERRRIWRNQQKRDLHRGSVLGLLSSCTTRSDVRSKGSASYTYLYRHDRQWLYEHLPKSIEHANRYKGSDDIIRLKK